MKLFINTAVNLLSFALTSYLAVIQKWPVQELCWSVWLAGLFYSWTCVIMAAIPLKRQDETK